MQPRCQTSRYLLWESSHLILDGCRHLYLKCSPKGPVIAALCSAEVYDLGENLAITNELSPNAIKLICEAWCMHAFLQHTALVLPHDFKLQKEMHCITTGRSNPPIDGKDGGKSE